MSCTITINKISIKEIAEESRKKPIAVLPFLTENQAVAVLASIVKTVNQAPDVISNGLGSYGLTMENLKLTGIVKGCVQVSLDVADLATILQDPSVFTGKNGVKTVIDLLQNEGLQRQSMIDVITSVMSTLLRQGTITGEESAAKLGAIAGLSSKYSATQIESWLNGTASQDLKSEMDLVASNGEFAVNLADLKSSDILEKIKGLGGGATSTVQSATGTINTSDIDAEVDKLVGLNGLIPSFVSESDSTFSKASSSLGIGDLF